MPVCSEGLSRCTEIVQALEACFCLGNSFVFTDLGAAVWQFIDRFSHDVLLCTDLNHREKLYFCFIQ